MFWLKIVMFHSLRSIL